MVKNPAASAGHVGNTASIPGSGRSPGGRNGNPLQYSCLKKIPWTEEPGVLQSMGLQRITEHTRHLNPSFFSLSLHLCRRETGNWSRALESQGSLCFAPDNSSAHVSSELLHVQLPGRRGSCSAHGSRSNHVPWICGDHIDMMPQGVGEAGVHRWRDRQNPEVQDTVEIKSFIPRWCQW